MGPVNWLAVFLAANLAVAIGIVWHGVIFGTGKPLLAGADPAGRRPPQSYAISLVVMLLAAAMLGHNYARLGADKLALKPWLYWMQSGGLAIAFVVPAVALGYLRTGADRRFIAVDCGYWLVAYLAMGTVFWALR
ncbi:MAG: DUF1761 domain-containing protein [Sphingomonadales bacterium]|nr:DUF1761 domain-containing protein [Sphingomonadales bacterium]